MNRRKNLHKILETILGSSNVYFQAPSSVKMEYPAIRYSRSRIDKTYSNDELYIGRKAYMVTVIDPDPDSEIPDKILQLPLCRPDRRYTADNLNHDVFTVYY